MSRANPPRLRELEICLGVAVAAVACGASSPDYFDDASSDTAETGAGAGGAVSGSGGRAGSAAAVEAGTVASAGASGSASGVSGASAQAGGASIAGATAGSAGGAASGAMAQSGSWVLSDFAPGVRCDEIPFGSAFPPGSAVQVFVTAVHPGSTWTHAPLARWIAGANAGNFSACVRDDVDYDRMHQDLRLDWLAVTPETASSLGFVSGRRRIESNTRTACEDVVFDRAFSAAPDVHLSLAAAEVSASTPDPAAFWLETVDVTGFRACARKLQGFTGTLAGLAFDWLAVPATLESLRFVSGRAQLPAFSDVHCTTIPTRCGGCRGVQLSINHRSRPAAGLGPHDPTLIWAEDLSAAGDLTVCVRETAGEDFNHDAYLEVSWLLERTFD